MSKSAIQSRLSVHIRNAARNTCKRCLRHSKQRVAAVLVQTQQCVVLKIHTVRFLLTNHNRKGNRCCRHLPLRLRPFRQRLQNQYLRPNRLGRRCLRSFLNRNQSPSLFPCQSHQSRCRLRYPDLFRRRCHRSQSSRRLLSLSRHQCRVLFLLLKNRSRFR